MPRKKTVSERFTVAPPIMLMFPEEQSKEEESDDGSWLHGGGGEGEGNAVGSEVVGLTLNTRMVGVSARVTASTTYSIEEGVRVLPFGVVNAS